MAHSPSHRSTHSMSQNNLQPPGSAPIQKQQRRMTSPASNSSLNPPEGHRPQTSRPPSPLRNGFVPDTFTGIDPDELSSDGSDDEDFHDRGRWPDRSPSPSSSVSQLAASFSQRVGSFLGNMAPRSPGGMPTDAELEAEAERERDRSRREAERILTREAQERKLVEERVLAMMENTRGLPPPPSRSQTLPTPNPNPPSPAGSSQKEGPGWWTAAKNRLTPTKEKEPLTPAQQVVHEVKSREKDKKGKGKEKDKDKEGTPTTQGRYSDSGLDIPQPPPPHRKPVPSSPSSPTPQRPNLSNLPPNLTPSPMRSMDAMSSSPSREAPPLYAQFNTQGTLDVPGTLLTIAKRFEKLEKWTVGHVRALEERMSDVERWLVDKEKEKEEKEEKASLHEAAVSSASPVTQDIRDMRDTIAELQNRVGELGREMAKLATAPGNLSSGPTRQPAPIQTAPPTTSSIAVHDSPTPMSTPHHSRLVSATARESTSPPMSSAKSASGTRLPYPAGDYYSSPPDSSILSQGSMFSPTNSPPSSVTSASRARHMSITGLPGTGTGVGLGISTPASSPPPKVTSPARATSPYRAATPPIQRLPPPKIPAARTSSVSPTPRKRYTVALGGPITAPPDFDTDAAAARAPGTHTAFFSSSPGAAAEDEFGEGDETIGKSAAAKLNARTDGDYKSGGDYKAAEPEPKRRMRPQSAYGFASLQPAQPLKPRLRTRSSERLTGGAEPAKFVDPLVLRRQDREGKAAPKPAGKVPIGQLVAFFDGDKKT